MQQSHALLAIAKLLVKKIAAVLMQCLILQNLCDFNNKRRSKVYCAFLDGSNAFDKVLISGLIAKLFKRHAPLAFIRILVSWYGSLQCSIVWNSLVSTVPTHQGMARLS